MKSERLMLALGTIIGVVGLLIFGRHVWNASAPGADPPGITIKSEILMVYAPKALIDFARAHPGITTNDELVRLTQQAKLHVWFATITWNYQANGVVADIPICYLPGEKPECFEVAADVLRALADIPPEPGVAAYRLPKIVIIEDAMMELEPVDGLRLLLNH